MNYTTGRNYGSPQVLEISFDKPMQIDDFELYPVKFVDAVRCISGIVHVFGMDLSNYKIGPSVLAEYDAGRYDPI